MKILRRTLCCATPALALALAVTGCAGQTTTQLQADVTAISSGLAGVVAALRALPGNPVPASVIAQAETVIADIQGNAAAIASTLTPAPSIVQAIGTAVSTLDALVAPFFPQAPAVAAVVQAALALVPVVLASAGIAAAPLAAPPRFTTAQARAILAAGVR